MTTKAAEPIATAWVSYMDEVIPHNAPPVQIQECKRAFYAGAQALLTLVTDLGEDNVSEDAGVLLLEAMHVEMRAFLKDVKAGRA